MANTGPVIGTIRNQQSLFVLALCVRWLRNADLEAQS